MALRCMEEKGLEAWPEGAEAQNIENMRFLWFFKGNEGCEQGQKVSF